MSLNDPRWGNQNNDDRDKGRRDDEQGPPDLEEVWRDFNKKLSDMFGGRKSGGGGGSAKPPGVGLPPKMLGNGIVILIFLAIFAWLASGFYTVDAYQRAVVFRFGEIQQVTGPGWHWRLPYPIEMHEKVDKTGVRVVEVGYRNNESNKITREALMLTEEENIINIQFAVQYDLVWEPGQVGKQNGEGGEGAEQSVATSPAPDEQGMVEVKSEFLGPTNDAVEYYLVTNRHPDEAVRQAAESAMREIVGRRSMDFVLYEGRDQIAVEAQDLMQRMLDNYKLGVRVIRVTMQNAQPPEQVQAAFDDAVRAGQDKERQRNEGDAYKRSLDEITNGRVARIKEDADAYRNRVVSRADGEAARFRQIYDEFKQAPEVTRERLYLETMQQVMTASSKVLVDAESGNVLLMPPLDKLIQGGSAAGQDAKLGGGTGSGAADASPTTTFPAPAQSISLPESRSRDNLRDRGGR